MKICPVVGSNIKRIRTSKKLSQEELAYKVGMDRPYLSAIENGRKNPSLSMLEHIAIALDIKITALFKATKAIRVVIPAQAGLAA